MSKHTSSGSQLPNAFHVLKMRKQEAISATAKRQKSSVVTESEGVSVSAVRTEATSSDGLVLHTGSRALTVTCSTVYKGVSLPQQWRSSHTVIYSVGEDTVSTSNRIAAFDFDGTLANTSVRRTGPHEWSILYPSIPKKLQQLRDEGYKLVVFTNESNIDKWKNARQKAINSKITRLEGFMKAAGVTVQAFIACGMNGTGDQFRKPAPGMWDMLLHLHGPSEVDTSLSFYVGDAAGRPGDHSDADKLFAEAVGLNFFVPEEFFGVTKK